MSRLSAKPVLLASIKREEEEEEEEEKKLKYLFWFHSLILINWTTSACLKRFTNLLVLLLIFSCF